MGGKRFVAWRARPNRGGRACANPIRSRCSLTAMSVTRTIIRFSLAGAVLLAGTWATVKVTTDLLLDNQATTVARNWALYLTDSVDDLEAIAGGEQPSRASMVFFETTR